MKETVKVATKTTSHDSKQHKSKFVAEFLKLVQSEDEEEEEPVHFDSLKKKRRKISESESEHEKSQASSSEQEEISSPQKKPKVRPDYYTKKSRKELLELYGGFPSGSTSAELTEPSLNISKQVPEIVEPIASSKSEAKTPKSGSSWLHYTPSSGSGYPLLVSSCNIF